MKPTAITAAAALSALILVGACSAPREYYGAGGAGAMTVTSRDAVRPSATRIDAASPVAMHNGDKAGPADIDAATLRGRFTKALEAQPLPPKRFVLYFIEGGDTLTAESQAQVNAILEEIKARPAPDLSVIGHTDRVGSVTANDQLALKRAASVREMLVKRGIDAEEIQASGRGEREPLVPTADEVAEPRNRRVEILVR